MNRAMNEEELPPIVPETDEFSFSLTLFSENKTTPKTTKEQLLEHIKENNAITREMLAEKLGLSINDVKQHIRCLKGKRNPETYW